MTVEFRVGDVVHGRPNPPVGALGDKFRPACSYWAVASTGRRWFDLDERCKALARERIGLYLEELAKPQPEPPAPEHEQEAML